MRFRFDEPFASSARLPCSHSVFGSVPAIMNTCWIQSGWRLLREPALPAPHSLPARTSTPRSAASQIPIEIYVPDVHYLLPLHEPWQNSRTHTSGHARGKLRTLTQFQQQSPQFSTGSFPSTPVVYFYFAFDTCTAINAYVRNSVTVNVVL